MRQELNTRRIRWALKHERKYSIKMARSVGSSRIISECAVVNLGSGILGWLVLSDLGIFFTPCRRAGALLPENRVGLIALEWIRCTDVRVPEAEDDKLAVALEILGHKALVFSLDARDRPTRDAVVALVRFTESRFKTGKEDILREIAEHREQYFFAPGGDPWGGPSDPRDVVLEDPNGVWVRLKPEETEGFREASDAISRSISALRNKPS